MFAVQSLYSQCLTVNNSHLHLSKAAMTFKKQISFKKITEKKMLMLHQVYSERTMHNEKMCSEDVVSKVYPMTEKLQQ